MIDAVLSRMRAEAARVNQTSSKTRIGIVSGYDPNNYAVKVRLQPEDTETGFMPLTSPMIGNGWGVFFSPQNGDQVVVEFQEGGHEVPFATLRLFDSQNRPLAVPSGEMWLVHRSGTALKFTNDGKLTLHSGTQITLDCPDVELGTGSVQALVLAAFQSIYNGHTHTVTAVGAPTTPPLIGGQMLPIHLTQNTKAS